MPSLTKIKAAGLLALVGWLLYTVSLRADRDRWKTEAAAFRQATAEISATLDRERAQWRAASQAMVLASQAQNAAVQADMERRVLIDEISRDCTVIAVPEGSIDEHTSGKVVEMLNSSLFAPLGGGVRTEAN